MLRPCLLVYIGPYWTLVMFSCVKVWNRDVPISTFVHEHAEGHIREALHGFCDDLLKLLDNFEEQLVFNKQKLILAMYKIQHEYQKYIEKRDIGHRFVLYVYTDNFEFL